MECEKDVVSYHMSVERQKVHIFLSCLDSEFEQICGEILCKDLILGLEECYSMIHHEPIIQTTISEELENSKASTMVSKNKTN